MSSKTYRGWRGLIRWAWHRVQEWFYWWTWERPVKRRRSIPPPPPRDLYDAEVKIGEAWRSDSVVDRDD